MIHNFYILKTNGICVFHDCYGCLIEDPQIIAGFLTAISMFAKSTIGESIKNLVTSNYKFVFCLDEGYLFVAFVDESDPFHKIQDFLKCAKDHFYHTYPELETKPRSYIPIGFTHFKDELESLINSHQLSNTHQTPRPVMNTALAVQK